MVGNRTNVIHDGNPAITLQYNTANQVTNPGREYDTSDNLLRDGAGNMYTYESVNRLTQALQADGTNNMYASHGDGVLLSATTDGVETRSTQDLAAPLSQVLIGQLSMTFTRFSGPGILRGVLPANLTYVFF